MEISDSRSVRRTIWLRDSEDPSDAIEPLTLHFIQVVQESTADSPDLVGLEGRVIEMSWYGDASVTVHLGGEFHILRKQLISSQVSRIPGTMLARWDHRRRMKAVFDLLRDPAYDMHITHDVSLEEVAVVNQCNTAQMEDVIFNTSIVFRKIADIKGYNYI
jgi:hypothetical protein